MDFLSPPTEYMSGEIGSEYRYYLDRKTVPQYGGNMLNPPSLLANKWHKDDVPKRGIEEPIPEKEVYKPTKFVCHNQLAFFVYDFCVETSIREKIRS